MVWSYGIPIKADNGELQELGDANILFSRKVGAREITSDKKFVWNYDAPPKCKIHTAQPIGKDRVMLMQNGNTSLINHRTDNEHFSF